jgi:hypothetical protein
METGYAPEDFCQFLRAFRPERAALAASFEAMRSYSGQSTRFPPERVDAALAQLQPGNFVETIAQLARLLGQEKSAAWFGAKETLCEEYLPCVLDHGGAGVVILRDPRDVLASLNHGRGEEFGGTAKPTLFNLRHWRKSVAFALHLQRHERFAWVRYEDVVLDPIRHLAAVTGRLGLDPFEEGTFDEGIRGQDGELWGGNSSHRVVRGVDVASVGTYADALPPEVVAFTEAVCYPEMKHLGYDIGLRPDRVPETIRRFRDPYDTAREELRVVYADADRTNEELARFNQLSEPEPGSLFSFADVHALLRTAAS